jgi:hypothetical protein
VRSLMSRKRSQARHSWVGIELVGRPAVHARTPCRHRVALLRCADDTVFLYSLSTQLCPRWRTSRRKRAFAAAASSSA